MSIPCMGAGSIIAAAATGDYTLIGSGSANVDGTYTKNGTYGGKTQVDRDAGGCFIWWRTADSYWYIGPTVGGAAGSRLYANTDTTLDPDPPKTINAAWTTFNGTPPAPVVT